MIMNIKQRKIKIESKIKLNYNTDIYIELFHSFQSQLKTF